MNDVFENVHLAAGNVFEHVAALETHPRLHAGRLGGGVLTDQRFQVGKIHHDSGQV